MLASAKHGGDGGGVGAAAAAAVDALDDKRQLFGNDTLKPMHKVNNWKRAHAGGTPLARTAPPWCARAFTHLKPRHLPLRERALVHVTAQICAVADPCDCKATMS